MNHDANASSQDNPLGKSATAAHHAASTTASSPSDTPISGKIILLLATACGLIVANVYYAQPLIGPIAAALGMSPQAAGLIMTLTQLGYGAGLLLLVPLGDLIENRKLTLCIIALGTVALVTAAFSRHPLPFLLAALCIGLGSVAVQILVPYAAHLSPEASRGRAVGNVMSGLMLGIMLARPVASLVADAWAWYGIFLLSAGIMIVLALVLMRALPRRQPAPGLHYFALLASMGHLLTHTAILRRRAFYHAFMFGAFSLFWTAIPLLLASPAYGLHQTGIAIFALVGVAGAVAAPIAGTLADRGLSRPATGLAMGAAVLAFLMTQFATPGSTTALVLLAVAAILLDFGVAGNLVLGQRAIFSLGAHLRSRLNGLFMAIFFVGGAIGSALGAWAFAQGGWPLTAWIGMAMPAAALVYYLGEWRN